MNYSTGVPNQKLVLASLTTVQLLGCSEFLN